MFRTSVLMSLCYDKEENGLLMKVHDKEVIKNVSLFEFEKFIGLVVARDVIRGHNFPVKVYGVSHGSAQWFCKL